MRNLTIIGRLGSDASVESTKNGTPFIKFSLASQEYNETETTWFNVTSFDQQLIKMASYYKKGTQLVVQGRLSFNKYMTKENIPAMNMEINAFYATFAGMATTNENGNAPSTNAPVAKETKPEDMTIKTKKTKTEIPTVQVTSVTTSEEDDLPF